MLPTYITDNLPSFISLAIGFVLVFVLFLSVLVEAMTPILPPSIFSTQQDWDAHFAEQQKSFDNKIKLGIASMFFCALAVILLAV